jgi:hypothetical protein
MKEDKFISEFIKELKIMGESDYNFSKIGNITFLY